MSTYDLSLIPSPDNGLVQLAGLAGIETPSGTDLSENQAGRIIATSIVLMVLSAIAVALRFLARRLSKAGLWWDDWTILAAMIMAWGCCLCMIIATTKGFGRHAAYFPDILQRVVVAESYFKIFYAYEALYTFSVALCKYSILLFYSRIFTERPFRIALVVMYVLVTLWLIAIAVAVFAECVPITGLWQLSEAARCIDLKKFFVGAGIPNLLLNCAIVFLPVPMIWTLDIERKYRIALSAVFGLGTFVIAVSLARVVVLANVSLTDITWNFVDPGIWTSVEPCIAVVSACLPILRSLWVWKRKRTQGKSTNTMQTVPRSPRHSVIEKSYPPSKPYSPIPRTYSPKNEKKIRHDSLTRPINETPAEMDGQWGATTDFYASTTPSRADSMKKSRYDDSDKDIALYDLPIQKQELSAEKTPPLPASGINKPLPILKEASEKKSHFAELYGS